MSKKKILLIYPFMMMGGSTTSLLSFLHNIDKDKFEIDLQLYRNMGPLLEEIPDGVKLLPAVKKYGGKTGKLYRAFYLLFSGYLFKAFFQNRRIGRKGFSNSVLEDCQAKHFSRKTAEKYDYAISFLEGWGNRYLAFNVNADKKYAWIHSTFSKTTDDVQLEKRWIEKVSKVVFVTEACRKEFRELLPEFADKALVIENIIDSGVIRSRAKLIDNDDKAYEDFALCKALKIITVCRITVSTKGLDRITQCAKLLKQDGTDFLWYIIGDGSDMPKLKEMIDEAGVSDCLVPIGQRMNPYPFIKASDIMCMPSRYEGKPMVITESMILGTPPVVTKYLSALDQIENGVDGIVIENADDTLYPCLSELAVKKDLIEKMRTVLADRDYGNGNYMRQIERKIFM